MISIIICSRERIINSAFYDNIINTIGCDYELIVIDNFETKYSIFEAYNLGIYKSKGEYLCFLHDDIIIHTYGWGNIVHRIFKEDLKIGLIGIAGAKIKTKMPSAWWDCPIKYKAFYIIQHFTYKEKEKWNIGFKKNDIEEVVIIDGVFMVARKDNRFLFDYKMKGFHNYDLNISLEYMKFGYKIVVTNKIILEHYSKGLINQEWINSTYNIHKKYKALLPLTYGLEVDEKLEITNAKNFIKQCFAFKKDNKALLVWFKLFCKKPFLKFHIKFWLNYLHI